MINIPSSLIKELRDRTNIGILECKQALIKSGGDIQLAIDDMRKNGMIKAAKKMGKTTKEGIILIQVARNKKYGAILELNCESDFVSRNNRFKKFGDYVITTAIEKKITDLNILQNILKEKNNTIISIFDENINIRRITHLEGEEIGSYLHNNKKIGVIISISGTNNNEKLLKHIAMHIAANKPEYVDTNQIPTDIINHEKNIQMDIALKSGKPYKIAKKITEGRINKFVNEISLMNQPFIMDEKKRIIDLLNQYNIKINKFIRFEVGENIK